MGYFASLMRQSGLRQSRQPARRSSFAIDVESSQMADFAAPSVGRSAFTEAATLSAAPQPGSAPHYSEHTATPGEAAAFPRDIEQTFSARPVTSVQPATEQTTLQPSTSVGTRPGANQVPVGVAPRQVTFSDIRNWVNADHDVSVMPSPESKLSTIPATPTRLELPRAPITTDARHANREGSQTLLTSEGDNYTLEIGSIQIVVEEPRLPAPVRPPEHVAAAPRPSAPDHSWTMASRHYLR